MRQGASRIGVELLLLGLVLGLLGGSVGLIIAVYRQRATESFAPVVAAVVAEPEPEREATSRAEPPPPPPPVDLTPERLGKIAAKLAEQKAVTDAIDRRAAAMEQAAAKALADAERYRARERLIRGEVASREADARRAEDEADALARERDILAEKRDEQRSRLEHAQLRARDGVAVLPYKGPNGTWRRPIAIECRGSSATLQPNGPTFTVADLAGFVNPRQNPLVLAVARTMLRARDTATPDGAPSVPYLMFIVRPDGIRPYYAVRSLLEPLGIAYGYELADADWEIEFPDLNDPSEWSEIPGPKTSPTWPPPPASGELADRRGPGNFDRGPGIVGGGPVEGPGGPGDRSIGWPGADPASPARVPGGSLPNRGARPAPGRFGGTNSGGLGDLSDGSDGRPAGRFAGQPPSDTAGGRVLATPGNGRGGGDGASPGRDGGSPWERPGNRRGTGIEGGLDEVDLESLSRGGGGGRDFPQDGRMPIHPGYRSEDPPSVEPTPPPRMAAPPNPGRGLPGSRGSGTVPNPGADADRSIAEEDGRTGTGGSGSAPARGTSGSRPLVNAGNGSGSPPASSSVLGRASASATMREAIARREGLETPKGVSGTPSTSAAGSSRTLSSGTPGQGGGMPGVGSASGGGSSGEGTGTGAGGYDTSNGIVSKTLEMSVACGSQGVTIHPGGETIAMAAMKADDRLLPTKLSAIVNGQRDSEPGVGLRPRVRFLVKPGGEATYLKARWQTSAAGTGWPLVLQVADRPSSRLFGGGKP
ncbi:MAG: hypothetical protein JWN86_3540 [Planctomycetota bacterium]|nr:hypothetical protein [Planctomycetota bacterium]